MAISSPYLGRYLGVAIHTSPYAKALLSRGLIFSLGPTLVQLFVVFPMKANKGVMGLDLGLLTPVFVFVFNAIWGLAAAIWLRWVNK